MKMFHPLIAAAVSASVVSVAIAQTTQPSAREQRLAARASAKMNAEAAELFRTADTTYLVGDLARAADLYRQILTVAPGSVFTVRVTARLGDCAYEAKAYEQAVQHYRQASALATDATDPEEHAAAVRADYMVGQSYLMAKQQIQAFGAFRRFIDKHPADPLVNKAYQSIGDAHMAVQQYQQALEAYRMVGTVFDKSQSTNNRIAPGQRLYLRVTDADVNIGDTPRSVYAIVRAKSGDVERVELKPLGLRSPVFIATIPTQLGPPLRSGDLNDAFPENGNQQVRDLLTKADQERSRATERSRELAELTRQGEGADPAGFERQRASLEDLINRHNQLAIDLQKQAFAMVDRGFAEIDKLLAAWAPDLSLAATRDRLATTTTAPADQADGALSTIDPSMADALARPLVAEDEPAFVDAERRGMTQAEIDRTRVSAAETPTDLTNIDKRLIALSIWHRALGRQFQRLEIIGSDTITVEYVDEVGPEGPNDASRSLRTDTIEVASDARIALLTPDGSQPISQAVLGGSVRVQVEDADRDVSAQPDTLKVTLCAIERPDEKLLELRAQTETRVDEVSAGRATPGLVAAPTTRPSEVLPLVVEGAKHIELTLTETSEHSGVFEASLELSKSGMKDLPLDPKKQLRLAYRDDRAIRNKDAFVHATQVDCIEDRGGSVAAVRYRQTQLDLQAKLARAVASGEIGKIYLELGLDTRGRAYLAAAQADCREVAQAAGKSPLGEESLYHSWRIYFYAGLLDESVAAANRLIQAYPLSEYCDDAMLAIGEASLEQGKKANEESLANGLAASLNRDLQRAVNQLDSLVKTYPSSPLAAQALFLIGQAKVSAGQTGLDAFEQLARQFPDSGFAARGLIQAADYYVSIADYRRAQEYFGRVLIDYPDSPQRGDVLLRRGVCQYKLGQNAEALATLYQVAEEHSGTDLAAEARKYINSINQPRGDAQ
jgi:TolA-binding protein